MSHVLAVLGVSLTLGPRTVAVVPVWVKEVSVSVIEVAVGLVRVIAAPVVSVTAPVSVSVTAVTAVSVWVMGGRREEKEGRGRGEWERVRHRWCILWTPSVQGAASVVDAAGT